MCVRKQTLALDLGRYVYGALHKCGGFWCALFCFVIVFIFYFLNLSPLILTAALHFTGSVQSFISFSLTSTLQSLPQMYVLFLLLGPPLPSLSCGSPYIVSPFHSPLKTLPSERSFDYKGQGWRIFIS